MTAIPASLVRENEATVVRDGRRYNVFFLRGHMRSGTNWCARLLNLHPRVAVEGEFHLEIVSSAIRRFTTESWSMGSNEPLRSSARALLKDFVREAIATLAIEHPGATWLGDQTPALIDPLLDGARHIVIVRDGRDVLVSWTFHQLLLGGPPDEPHRSDMAHLRDAFQKNPTHFKKHPEQLLSVESWVRSQCRCWKAYIREHTETMAKADAGEIDARILMVKYEDLHADTEAWRRRMYDLLDVDPDEAAPLSVKTRTMPGFNRDDPTKFCRKGEPMDWLNYFNDDVERWFFEEAREELIDLGYDVTPGRHEGHRSPATGIPA